MGYKVKKIYVGTQQVRPALPIPSSGLLGYRPLQSDLKDASGNGKDGSWYSGTGSFGTVGGYTGARVERSSYTSTQHIVTSLTYGSSPMTLMGWMYFNSFYGSGYWGGLINNSVDGSVGFQGINTRGTYLNIIWQSNGRFETTNLSTGSWYFFAATMDISTCKVYVNGSLVGTESGTFGGSPIGVFRLGCGQVGNGAADGWVRHCAVYNRVLTADEILESYNNTK